ncbi:MAG: isocitrate/isopropylmalate dehydrogenase family protein [Candidatus Marsarchaeota archaeon]|jgi:isopropylmalate/isohomocitrate dehydrogenase-like protein|nr:isocitrate/isopropylmalate dehydrogenase family protein [Candidatus Marsarchaeota archaeon]
MDNKRWNVAVLPGDGIGPDVMNAAMLVLNSTMKKFDIDIKFAFGDAGYNCIKKFGTNLPDITVNMLKKSDCILKGPMTTPEEPGSNVSAAVQIRTMFNLYANVRPIKSMKNIKNFKENVDLVIVRENTEGMYSGKEFRIDDTAIALRIITKKATERIAKYAFHLAEKRKKHLTYVHKQNILKISDGLFNETILEVSKQYPSIKIDDAHVDAMAQWLIKQPEFYDVIVTENLFGDILSDEAAMLVGGIGITPGANIGDNYAMFEPIHGSAPKYTGQDKADPIAMVLSTKMMLEWMGYENAAISIQNAVEKVLEEKKVLTYDLGGKSKCSELGNEIAGKIETTVDSNMQKLK